MAEELEKLAKEILEKKNELKNLDHGAAIASHVMTRPVAAKKDDLGVPSLDVISEEQFAGVVDRLSQADLELIDAQAKLETARLARKAREARPDDQPAIAEGSKQAAEEKIQEQEAAVEEIKRKRIGYLQYLEKAKVQTRFKNNDTLAAGMVNQELSSLLKMQEIINQKLEQLNFETKQDVYRISQHDRAGVPKVPSNKQAAKYMAAAPVGVLFLILGWFLIVEIKAGPVADPKELSSRKYTTREL